MSLDVWAQADVVVARLTVEPSASAGWLETTLMEAIGAGVGSPFDLADIFGLAPSLVLNILGDLWRAGRISFEDTSVGVDRESLALTSSGRSAIGRDGQPAKTTAQTTVTEELVIERLTGRVLPAKFASGRPPSQDVDLVVPPLPTDAEGATVTIGDLRDALATAIDRNQAGLGAKYRGKRVRSAALQPAVLQNGARRRYVKIGITAHRSEIDELTVAVVDAHLTLRERELATRRLQAALDGAPKSRFANRVRERASRVPLQPQGIDRTLHELRDVIHTMANCAVGNRQQCHEQARHLATQVATYAGSLAAQEMQIELLTSTAEHRGALNELIRSATSQVVIAVPWIKVRGLEAIRASLLDAVDRGVQVVLIWGIDGAATSLGTAEESWLDAISAHTARAGARGKLLYSRDRGSRSHAKLAVADDRRMMVTSMNFLSNSSHTEVGVVLTALTGQQSPAISDALQYAYDKAPTPQIAYSLNRVPGAFGDRTTPDAPEVAVPRFTKALGQENTPDAVVRAWAAAWSECFEELTTLLHRPNPTVELIADLQHRGVLRNALTEARSRVLVTSDKLTDSALSEDLVVLTRRRSHEGLPVQMRYRSATNEGQPRVAALRSPGDGQQAPVTIDREGSMHAKVVLRDDRVLLGSFNPLSVDADLRQRRSTGELGVDIRSAQVTADIWSAITGTRPPTTAAAHPDPVDKGEPERLPHASVAQELLEALGEPSFAPILDIVHRIGFAEALCTYTAFDDDPIDITRIAAAGLRTELEQGQPISGSTAILLRQQLRAGNWGVAQLLREHTNDADLPSRQFIESLDSGGRSGEALLYADYSDTVLPLAEYESLSVVDFVALLLGDAQASDSEGFFDAAKRYATTESAAFSDAATAYLRRYSVLPPAPPVDTSAAAERIAASWKDAQEAVAGLKRYDPRLDLGYAFQRSIFGPHGEMTVLEMALSARNADAVIDWLAAHVPNRNDDKWFNRATGAAHLKITGSRRQSFIMWRSKVRTAVAHLADALQSVPAEEFVWDADQTASLNRVLDAGRELCTARSGSDRLPQFIVGAELTRLLNWSARLPISTPSRDWRTATFVRTSIVSAQETDLPSGVLLAAVAEDLGAVRSEAESIIELAEAWQFSRARDLTAQAAAAGLLDQDEASALTKEITRIRNDAVRDLDEEIAEQELRNAHAGIESSTGPRPVIDDERDDDGLVRAGAQRDSYRRASAAAYAAAYAAAEAAISAQVESRSSVLVAEWREYINDLIAAGEFAIAERALDQRNGDRDLPRPRPFARWSWAGEDIGVVARWFLTADSGAPHGMRERFLPTADDAPGCALVAALPSLAGPNPDPTAWVSAVHQLVSDDDEYESPPEVSTVDGYTRATLRLPHTDKLPRLRWADGDPVSVALGDSPAPDTLFRLSTDMSRTVADDPVLTVADLLSLLARRDGAGAPTLLDRKLQFLSTLCSRLPLDDVIDPAHMPAALSEGPRRQLAWLISIIGVQADLVEVDRLRIWAGGHAAVLWALIDTVQKDHISKIAALADRTTRNSALMRGLSIDLGLDMNLGHEDILMLAIGVLAGLEDGCTIPALVGAFEDEWIQGSRLPHGLRLTDVIGRLIAKGYLVHKDGMLRSCGCAVTRALADAADAEWMSDRMDAVDPSRFVRARAYDFILDRMRHDQQAAGEILDEDEMRAKADVSVAEQLSDGMEEEFDLATLCERACRDYRSNEWDLEFVPPRHPMPVNGIGPKMWVALLVTELLNNAVKAVTGLPPGVGTVWVDIDSPTAGVAVLRIQNNGNRMPPDIVEAFADGLVVHKDGRPLRGTGLVGFKRFGEVRGVTMNLDETPAGETVVECRFPLTSAVT